MLKAHGFEPSENFDAFLQRDLDKGLLRFSTAGSVDDGKSTLIGRLLHDSKAVYEDQLAAVKNSRVNRSGRAIDFSLLTDGLRAEREQGITIDVAYRYFSTARRKFIIADTPGHEQYTRNMATGASTADLAVILVDATKGLLAQTRRHSYIAALLGIPNVVAAINKMDLVDYNREVFWRLDQDFSELASSMGIRFVRSIPISALEGHNVVEHGENMPWYTGPTVLEHLETVEIRPARDTGDFRFPVQHVIRPDANFRGFAGRLASGAVSPGYEVVALPSLQRSRVQRIVTYDGDLEAASAGQSVTITLENEIDLSRGDMLVSPQAQPLVSKSFAAMLVWLHADALELNRTYLLKQTSRQIKAEATRLRFRVNVNDLTEHSADRLEMNEIACVELEASAPLFFDLYEINRTTGSFILIDPFSNATVGAGMICQPLRGREASAAIKHSARQTTTITAEERARRNGHRGAVFLVGGSGQWAEKLERQLFERGFQAVLLGEEEIKTVFRALLDTLLEAGLIIVCATKALGASERSALRSLANDSLFELVGNSSDDELASMNQALRFAEELRVATDSTERKD